MTSPEGSPWLRAADAAAYATVSKRILYDAVRQGHLRAAYIGAGRSLRFNRTWLDEWMRASAERKTSIRIVTPRTR